MRAGSSLKAPDADATRAPWLTHSADLLRNHRGFASSDAREAQDAVARALNRHATRWGRGEIDAALHKVSVGGVSILLLRYGTSVKIEPEPLGDFYILQVPLCGSAEVRSGGRRVEIDPERGVVLSPRARIMLDWAHHCEQVLVKIPVATVEGLWRSVLERPMPRAPEFDLSFRPGEAELGSLMQCIDYAVRETLVTQNTPAGRAVGRRLEELLVLKLLASQPHSHSDEMARHQQTAIAPRHVRAAEEFMTAHLHEPVTLHDLADAAGVSVRTLNKVFRDFRRTSPMSLMRDLRLERARAELAAAAPGARVAEIAERWGFAHLGRFAASYRLRYGESPSETLGRAPQRSAGPQ